MVQILKNRGPYISRLHVFMYLRGINIRKQKLCTSKIQGTRIFVY